MKILYRRTREWREWYQHSDGCRLGNAEPPEPLQTGMKTRCTENSGIGVGNDRAQTRNIIDCLHHLRTTRHNKQKEILLPTEFPVRQCFKGQNWGLPGSRVETSICVTDMMIWEQQEVPELLTRCWYHKGVHGHNHPTATPVVFPKYLSLDNDSEVSGPFAGVCGADSTLYSLLL